MPKTICFYHDDLDGIASAAIVRRKLGKEVELREMRYGMDSTKDVEEGSEIYFVDFSPRGQEELKTLVEDLNCKVTIIDHHKTAYNQFIGKTLSGKMVENTTYKIDMSKAGCQLTWEFFYPEEKMPTIIHHIGEYDRWDHSDPLTLPLYYGMMFMEPDPSLDEMWNEIIQPTELPKNEDGLKMGLTLAEILVNMGETALRYRALREEYDMRRTHVVTLHGIKTAVCNGSFPDSYAFNSFFADEEKSKGVEAMCWYYRTPKGTWKYSLRSAPGTDTDVSQIAEQYPGGGGHPGSAGFVSDELLPEIANSGKE